MHSEPFHSSEDTQVSSDAMEIQCPLSHTSRAGRSDLDRWPSQLRLDLEQRRSFKSNPMGENPNDANELESLDLEALKKDLLAAMTDSPESMEARTRRSNSSAISSPDGTRS